MHTHDETTRVQMIFGNGQEAYSHPARPMKTATLRGMITQISESWELAAVVERVVTTTLQ
eukprot:2766354-Amphidinium_carterae.1